MEKYYDVYYLDAVKGGSGFVRVHVSTLHVWLEENPGYLIRRLQPLWKE